MTLKKWYMLLGCKDMARVFGVQGHGTCWGARLCRTFKETVRTSVTSFRRQYQRDSGEFTSRPNNQQLLMTLLHRLFPCSLKHDVTAYIIRKTEDYIFHQKYKNDQLLCILLRPVNFTAAFNELADCKARRLSKICTVIVQVKQSNYRSGQALSFPGL